MAERCIVYTEISYVSSVMAKRAIYVIIVVYLSWLILDEEMIR